MPYTLKKGIKYKLIAMGLLVMTALGFALWLLLFKPMSKHSDVEVFLNETNKKPKRAVEKLADFPVYIPMEYTGKNDRSPFQESVKKQLAMGGQGPDLDRPRSELEAFALDSLHMVGVISQNNQLWAIIQSPDNRVYRVSIGDFIGKNYGEIIEITPSEIKVSESVSDGYGNWAKRPTELILSE